MAAAGNFMARSVVPPLWQVPVAFDVWHGSAVQSFC
jgi:hypothetical protein